MKMIEPTEEKSVSDFGMSIAIGIMLNQHEVSVPCVSNELNFLHVKNKVPSLNFRRVEFQVKK